MRVDVTPRAAEIGPGQQLFLTVTITNTSTVIGGYQVRMLGADPGWVQMDGEQVSLFPGRGARSSRSRSRRRPGFRPVPGGSPCRCAS